MHVAKLHGYIASKSCFAVSYNSEATLASAVPSSSDEMPSAPIPTKARLQIFIMLSEIAICYLKEKKAGAEKLPPADYSSEAAAAATVADSSILTLMTPLVSIKPAPWLIMLLMK